MTRVFVGVGSSLAPEENVSKALESLDRGPGIVALSTFYRTPALGRPTDPPFVNGVVEVGAGLAPAALRALLRSAEAAAGRQRGADAYAPRPIDLDLLLYGNLESRTPHLGLPHPDVSRRSFVAIPLLELAPDLVLPGSRQPLASVARAIPPWPMEPLHELTRSWRERFRNHPRADSAAPRPGGGYR